MKENVKQTVTQTADSTLRDWESEHPFLSLAAGLVSPVLGYIPGRVADQKEAGAWEDVDHLAFDIQASGFLGNPRLEHRESWNEVEHEAFKKMDDQLKRIFKWFGMVLKRLK